MTDYTLSGAFGAGPGASASDPGSQYTLGLSWSSTAGAPLWLKGYEFWRADGAVDGPISAETWDQSGTPLADSSATFVLSGTGNYQQVLLPVPVPIVVGQSYRSGAHFPDGAYSFVSNYWSSGAGSSGLVVGRLTAPSQADAPDTEQGVLIPGAVRTFPANGSPAAANYLVTPILTDVAPFTPSGAVSLPVSTGVTVLGQKVVARSVSAPLAVTAGITGAHRGAGAITTPIAVGMSVAGEDPSAAPVSAVLCSAWASPSDIPEVVRAELGLSESELARALMIASELLWALSGRRWYGGGCLEEAYLRSTPPRPGTGTWPYHRSWGNCSCWLNADWINGYPAAAYLGAWEHVAGPYAVRLPRAPVMEIASLTINGQPFTSYNLNRSGWLERLDGKPWDTCSDSTVVTYRHGEPPPLGGVQSAITLGVELARDMYDISGCRLPKRITTITRQGVTVDIADSLDILDKGGTGIVSVDLWLRSVNPEARPQRAGVWSPDVPRLMPRRPL